MTGAKVQSHTSIMSLVQKVMNLESNFPSSEDLESLGIQAEQVSLKPDQNDTLDFNPCFFRPQPDKLLQRYPVNWEEYPYCPKKYLRVWRPRTVQDFINEFPEDYPPDVVPKFENLTSNHRFCYEFENEPFCQAYETYMVVETHIDAPRKGPSDNFHLHHPNLETWSEKPKEGDLPSMTAKLRPYVKTWRVYDHERYTGGPFKPHSVLSCGSDIVPTDTNGLTTHELRAIVCTIIRRMNYDPFKSEGIHPILVFSYLGGRQGRIIQALYDGEALAVQYSQLWRFMDAETAPVELFVRYRLSEPVA